MQQSFRELMKHAAEENYAVGYFEAWNLESILAVADASEESRSPVILGFSGIYLPHPERMRKEHIGDYAATARAVCSRLSVPCCSVFNESADMGWVKAAAENGFDLVMYTDEGNSFEEQKERVRSAAEYAHSCGAAAEGECTPLPGAGNGIAEGKETGPYVPVEEVESFVAYTGIDAFAVDLGQQHLHGREKLTLDIERLKEIKKRISLPLVLHGASSIQEESIRQAVQEGIVKINVGSVLKLKYIEALRNAAGALTADFNPYEAAGSGLPSDILIKGRIAVQKEVERLMRLFGSAGKGG